MVTFICAGKVELEEREASESHIMKNIFPPGLLRVPKA